MKKFIIILLAIVALPAFSASVLKQARESLKKKQNLEQTAKNLLAEAVKQGTSHKDRIECYLLAAECSQRINDVENEKLYLKQKYDTAKFFSSILDMQDRLLLADSLSCLPDEKGVVREPNRKKSHDLIMHYRQNMLAGAYWFYRHNDLKMAYRSFDSYISVAEHPILAEDSLMAKDTNIPHAAYIACVSSHGLKNPDGVIRYAELGKTPGMESDLIQELLVRALETKKDTAQWEAALWQGLREFPHYSYFFTRLIDRLSEKGQLDVGLAVADSLIRLDDSDPLYWYAKSLILMKQQKDEEVIAVCDECIARDSAYVDAYYNKGIAALNLALFLRETACTDLEDPECIEQRKRMHDYYELARGPMERVRQMQPDAKDRWVAPLYRIYLNLNMGKEFDEMDALLNGK